MNDKNTPSRRDFLKLSSAGLLGAFLAELPLDRVLAASAAAPAQGRIAVFGNNGPAKPRIGGAIVIDLRVRWECQSVMEFTKMANRTRVECSKRVHIMLAGQAFRHETENCLTLAVFVADCETSFPHRANNRCEQPVNPRCPLYSSQKTRPGRPWREPRRPNQRT